ncbi:MAG: outer membrane protein assembly factor BamD [Ignavibacteriales bacterium]|nr:outer membrane protein assembly factor BamD [Ignavibacteriales bacterium]
MTERKTMIRSVILTTMVGCALVLAGCAATHEAEQLSVEKRFEHAMALVKDESYLDAYEEFRIVTLQYQGSTFADQAQFFMAECRYRREEYVLAAYEYDVLVRTMPTSKYVPQARFQRAMCYYRLSPASYLDQTYTRQAVDEFQSFIEYHPTDSLVTQAEAKISELNMKSARKEFENGITYIHMEYYKAAVTSFDHVLEKYHDTPYAEQAQYKKAEVMLMRNKVSEAKAEVEKFLLKYPNSTLKSDALDLQKRILSRPPQKPAEPRKNQPVSSER